MISYNYASLFLYNINSNNTKTNFLHITGNSSIKGNVLIQSNLNVLQDTNIKQNLDITQFTTIHRNLNVKEYTLSNNLIVDNYSRLKGQLTTDNVFTTGTLTVDKNTILKDRGSKASAIEMQRITWPKPIISLPSTLKNI